MSADAGTFYTQLFSLVTIVAVALGGWYSFREYRSNFGLQLKAAQSQALQPFLTKQIELCSDVSQAAATLALSKNEPKRQQASDTLYTLSLGPLRIVEQTGDKIGPAITAFESCLESKCATFFVGNRNQQTGRRRRLEVYKFGSANTWSSRRLSGEVGRFALINANNAYRLPAQSRNVRGNEAVSSPYKLSEKIQLRWKPDRCVIFRVIFRVKPRYFPRQNDRAGLNGPPLLHAADFPRRGSRPIVFTPTARREPQGAFLLHKRLKLDDRSRMCVAACSAMNPWKRFQSEFEALRAEEDRIVQERGLRDWFHGDVIYGESGEFGSWSLAGSATESLQARFELLATEAGIALGSPAGTLPHVYWLHRLFVDLRANKSRHIRIYDTDNDIAGIIECLLEVSATYCARLNRQSLENAAMSPEDASDERRAAKDLQTEVDAEACESPKSELSERTLSDAQDAAMPLPELAIAASDLRGDRTKKVDDFLVQCNRESAAGFRVMRKHIWRAVGHARPRQFQYWQEGSDKATDADDRAFRRILCMPPSEFIVLLKIKGIFSQKS